MERYHIPMQEEVKREAEIKDETNHREKVKEIKPKLQYVPNFGTWAEENVDKLLKRELRFGGNQRQNEGNQRSGRSLMLIKKATMFADPIMKIGTIGLVKLIQFMARW